LARDDFAVAPVRGLEVKQTRRRRLS